MECFLQKKKHFGMINKDGLLNLLIGGRIGPKRLVELSARGLETTMMLVSFDATVVSHV